MSEIKIQNETNQANKISSDSKQTASHDNTSNHASKPTKTKPVIAKGPNKKILMIAGIVTFVLLAILAIVLALVFALKKGDDETNKNATTTTTTTKTLSPKSQNCFGFAITNCNLECGLNLLYGRIVGGVEATPNSWPSTVYLSIAYSFPNMQLYQCGGSLIDEYTILTAAHCVQPTIKKGASIGSLAYVDVFFGVHNLVSSEYVIRSSRIITHEKYDANTQLNDIALIKLSSKAILGKKVQIACLPNDTISVDPNTDSIAVGWGTQSFGGVTSNVLLQVNLTIYDPSICPTLPNLKKDWNTQLCAGDLLGKKDTCQGDSGGPLFIKQTFNGISKLVVAGLTSYGDGCAIPDAPGIYTRTSGFISWILKNI